METSVFNRTRATLVWLVLVGSVVELSGCVGSEANEPAAVGDGDVAAAVRELAASGRGIGDGPARLIAPLSG
jgi:hypothetical protein